MAKHKGDELKMFIVQQVLKGNTIYSLSKQFDISKNTIKRWDGMGWDFDITEQWLGKVLKVNDITRKQVRKYHSPYYRYGKVVDRSQLKSRFYDKVKEFPLDRIICLDETAVQLYMHRNYARCNIGERCSITTTSNTVFKSYTLLVAISSSKVVGWKLYEEGGTNEHRLIDFVTEFITSKYHDHLVIMDNAPSHRKETVKQAIENNGN